MSASQAPPNKVPFRAAVAMLVVHLAVVLFSLTGTGLRAVMPEAAPDWDYEALATHLARANIASGGLCAFLLVAAVWGWGRAAALLGGCIVVAGGTEYLSTLTGYPFGEYEYTERLGPRFLGRVPYLIPMAWLMVLGPALLMARHARLGRLQSCLLAGAIVTLWDVVLDPIMSGELAAWRWSGGSIYYDIPLINYPAWFVVGALSSAPAVLGRQPRTPGRRAFAVAATLVATQNLFAGLMAAHHQKHLAVVVWALGGLALLVYLEAATRSTPPTQP